MPLTSDDELGAVVSQAQALAVTGDRAGARACYAAMWADATRSWDDYQACVATHFMAHEQDDPGEQLAWHLRALHAAERADANGEARVRRFYPSLHANLADVYLRLGDRVRAREQVERARAAESALPDDGYGRMIRGLIARLAQSLVPGQDGRP